MTDLLLLLFLFSMFLNNRTPVSFCGNAHGLIRHVTKFFSELYVGVLFTLVGKTLKRGRSESPFIPFTFPLP